MTLHIEDKWVWDFWFSRDGSDYHIFYLQALRSLGDTDARHWHCSIGHAVSSNLTNWEILPDALAPSQDVDAWDSMTTWTGSVVKHNNTWYMYYTGTSHAENGKIQRIGMATSEDLVHWTKFGSNPLINIDPQWYETFDKAIWYEQTWRDPWIFKYDDKFHALITARSKLGKPKERGIVGHAISNDLIDWETVAPLTEPGEFAYLEVPQLVKINQKWYLNFCVSPDRYSEKRLARKGVRAVIGSHYMIADHPLGPFNLPPDDVLYGDEQGSSYAGKLIHNNSGEWEFMTAINYDPMKGYIGDISNPMLVIIGKNGELRVNGSNVNE